MIEANSNHCQIVEESLTGERTVDERTFASLAILAERLERLKKLNRIFSNVTFSSAVKKLEKHKNVFVVHSL